MKRPLTERPLFSVRPAWAHSCGGKSRRKLITANEPTAGGWIAILDRTAQRVFKLIAKDTARLMVYASSDACLFAFHRSIAELDATPDSFCEPDLSALVAAGIARSPR